MRKTLVIGLDAAPPRLLYREFLGELENLSRIVSEGARFELRSCYPPITIPAWAVMVTGKTPGELGLYGFRHRRLGSFSYYIANSRSVREKCIWDLVGEAGGRSIVVGVPPSYPPKPIRGDLISCFITPGPDKNYTWPPFLKREIEKLVGEYIFDVVYRSERKREIIRGLWSMTEKRFRVLEYLAEKRRWDFYMFVEIGVDRVQHAFWKYFDKKHPKYPGEGNEFENVILEYYKLIDKNLERLLKKIPRDAVLVVVSDHGAKAMKGAFAINEWLMREGLLKLKKKPGAPCMDLEEDMIDWSKTIAWGWGGYYSRIFINLEGREPNGIVRRSEYESVIEDLKDRVKRIKGPNGEVWENIAVEPREVYPEVKGDAPDLMVFLDNLNWRAAGTIGWPSMYLEENDRGPDDAVHDWNGVFTVMDPEGTVESGDMGVIGIEGVRSFLEEVIFGEKLHRRFHTS